MQTRNQRAFNLPRTLILAVVITSTAFMGPLACAQENRSKSRSTLAGTAHDANTGEPIAGAYVFEVIPAGTSGADVRRVAAARMTRTDPEGRFRFETQSRGFSIGAARAPRYHFYDPSYGLIRGPEASGKPIEFTPSLRDAHLRQADATALCPAARRGGADLDVMTRQIGELACPPARLSQFANGHPRTRGAVDAKGRRTGAWVFFRENGSVIAQGDYQSGAAVGDWRFNPPGPVQPD